MLEYNPQPIYELALSGGTFYAYVAYVAYPMMPVYLLSLLLSLTSVWFHGFRSPVSFWIDQLALHLWVCSVVYEAYIRNWIAFGLAMLCILYAFLMFYVGQLRNTYAYHPSRFWSIFFHTSVHMTSAMSAIFVLTFFPVPK